MSQSTIVLCFPVTSAQVSQIQTVAGPDWRVLNSNQEDIGADILDADIFCGHAKQNQIDWDEVVRLKKLKWIQSSAAGLDHCLVPAVVNSEIIVSSCSGLFARQVAEQTMALLFGLLRSMPLFYAAQAKKEFVRRPTDELRGKTVGILGFGGNGQQIARALRPLATRIIATDIFCGQVELSGPHVDQVLSPENLPDLLAESDVVILTLPLTQNSELSFGRAQFQAMKSGSWFVNVGRGSVVDHDALYEALENGRLAGAGLDVCDPEPLPASSPLWEHPGVIITPHVGAQSATRVPVTVKLFCENFKRYGGDDLLLNLVDKRLGFPRPQHRIDIEIFD